MTDERTVKYYDLNAKKYAEETNNADMSEAYSHFIKHIPNNGRIIDIGCGGGRDLKYFSDVGYQAEGLDVSEPLCLIASNYSNCKVYCSDLSSWKPDYCYDAIWANASLLHLSEEEILKFFETKKQYIKDSGVIFFSMKKGIVKGFDSEGRFFTPFSDELLQKILDLNKDLKVIDMWEEKDSLLRAGLLWKCIILNKTTIMK